MATDMDMDTVMAMAMVTAMVLAMVKIQNLKSHGKKGLHDIHKQELRLNDHFYPSYTLS